MDTSTSNNTLETDSIQVTDFEDTILQDTIAANTSLEEGEVRFDPVSDELDFVFQPFDEQLVLDRLQLEALQENRSLKILLASELRENDELVPDVLETGDGTFDIYKLRSDGIDLAYFYYENDVIGTIEIIHSGGVPDGMIRPGHTYEQLQQTYENPIAYGSVIEARVFIYEDGIGFRMDTSYGIYEPIDLEDDTEILYIQF